MNARNKLNYLLVIAGVVAGSTAVSHAQLHVGGSLLVDVDATTGTPGALTSITNNGTLGGLFEARGGGATVPVLANVHGNGTIGIQMDGGDYMQLVDMVGGTLITAPAGISGVNPTYTIEAWVLNPVISQEETVVAWGKRGPDVGGNCSFNYGWSGAYGAMGHWGGPDLGWENGGGDVYSTGTPSPGVWHHLVYTFDGTTQNVYSDGVLKATENVGLNIAATAINLGAQLDGDGTTVTAGLRGSLSVARLRIHEEALNAAQVGSNYTYEASSISNGGELMSFRPKHRYSFNNPAGVATSGSVLTDTESGAHGVVLGAGGTFSGTRLVLPGGGSGTQAYGDLPNRLVSTNGVANGGSGEVSIEAWVKVTGSPAWGRIFDIGSSVFAEVPGPGGGGEGKDYLMWSATINTDANNQRVELRNEDPGGGGIATVDHYTSSRATYNKDIHIVLTWNESTGEIICYENGTRVAAMTAPGVMPMSALNDVNVWLGRSNWTGDNNMQGEFDEFRIYNHVLTPAQIHSSYVTGPNFLPYAQPVTLLSQTGDQTVPELTSPTFSITVEGLLPITYQWYTNGVEMTGATGSSVTLNSVVPSLSGLQVRCIASNNISGNAYYATSAIATLTVLGDTNAPGLVLARVAGTNKVEVVFTEGVNATDAADAANYAVTGTEGGLPVTAATVLSSDRVVLTLGSNLLCGYYTVAVSNIHDLSASANVIPPGSSSGFWNYTPDGITHRYTFNSAPGNASNATLVDIVGGADGIVRSGGGPALFTGNRLTLSGGSGSYGSYGDLPNGLLSINSTNNGGSGKVSFEGWVKVTGNQSWSRIFDFGSTGVGDNTPGHEVFGPSGGEEGIDYLFYSAQVGGNTGRRRIDLTNRDQGGHGTVGNEWNVDNFNQDVHFVVTWDEATGVITVHENGVQMMSVTTVAAMSEINDVNVWLGRSTWTVDANMQGEFDEFRIYNRILAPAERNFSRTGGADAGFGAPLGMVIAYTNTVMITNTVLTVPILVHFANVGTQNIAGVNCATYSSTDPTVAEITADGILHAYNAGTSVVTAVFGGISDTATIIVTGDSTPPALLSARAVGPRHIELVFSETLYEPGAEELLNYEILTPSGSIDLMGAELSGVPNRVLLTTVIDLPCEYIRVHAMFIQDPVGNTMNDGYAYFTHLQPASLKHRFSFNNFTNAAASGLTVLDSVAGGSNGLVLGSPARFTGDRVQIDGGNAATAAYVDLPNGLLSANSTNNGGSGQFSVEGWVKITGNRSWSRIFDFGSTGPEGPPGHEVFAPSNGEQGADYFFLSAQQGGNTGIRQMEIANRDQSHHGAVATTYFPTNFGQDIYLVVTWDEATGQIRTYENGVQVASMNTVAAMSEINDVNVWLGRSNWTVDENMQGEFDEFRSYNRLLTATDMAINQSVGPDNNYGMPLAIHVTGPSALHCGQSGSLTVTVDFQNISNVNLTASGCIAYQSSASSVISNGAPGVVHALSTGSATLTVSFSGLSSNIVIEATNAAPTPAPNGLATPRNTPAVITIAALLLGDTDPDGDLVSFSSVSATSTNGGTVTLGLLDVTYAPATNYTGPDLFTYTVTDPCGATTTADVYVYVTDGPVPGVNNVAIRSGGGNYTVTFQGTPGTTYRIQRATIITGPWDDISTQTVNPSGIIAITDSSPPPGQAFYRVITP
jgi:hypothetical protein